VLTLTQVRARAFRGYQTANGLLPPRMSWLEPGAAAAFAAMNAACDRALEYTDVYRSVIDQIRHIKDANAQKKRLFAPPTKSGHNFGFAVDIAVDESRENFRKSGRTDLLLAARDPGSFARWLRGHGWTGISKESWHFEFLDGHESALAKIEAVYGPDLGLDNAGVQRALNRLLADQLAQPLVVDGQLGPRTHTAAMMADRALGLEDNGACGPWFRRVLAGATMVIKEVGA